MPRLRMGAVVLYHFKRLLPSGDVVIDTRPAMVLRQEILHGDEFTQLDVCFANDDIGPGGEPYTPRTRRALYHSSIGNPTHNTWSFGGLQFEVEVLGRSD